MARSKLRKFKALGQFAHVAQIGQGEPRLKLKKFINKNRKLTLELGCGRGDYTLALARQNPDQLFVGIDIQGERLWYGASQARGEKLNNILFLRLPLEKLTEYFSAYTVDKIWLTFPDPYPKKKQSQKRLTTPHFLKMYQKILKPAGLICLKTDDPGLWQYTLETVQNMRGQIKKQMGDLYARKVLPAELAIQTHFEKKHLAQGKKIHFLSWQF